MLRRSLSRLLAAAAAVVGVAVPAVSQQPAPTPGVYALPTSAAPFLPGSSTFRLGGFSGLSYAGGNEFWTITDRGPNVDSGSAKVFPLPSFNPMIVRLRANADGSLSILGTMPLQRTGGGPVSGRPTPAPYNTGEYALDPDFKQIAQDEWGFDTEGLVRAADGTFWFCEEYAPGIAKVSPTGEILLRVRPQPTPGGLPDILKKHVPNRGAEGIAITPNGKIYTVVQSGMANSFANTASANTSAANQTELLRLVEFDPVSGVSRMFAYLMDAGYPVTGSNIRRRDIKIGDMVALNNNELMLIEHAQRGSQNAKRIYKINLAGATPLVTETFQTSPGGTKTLEELTRAELTSVAGITPVAKTLVLDLLNAGAGNPTWPTDADKPEGMTLIDPSTIVLANDNDFGVNSPNADGIVTFTGAQSRLFVYKLPMALSYQAPSQAPQMPPVTGIYALPAAATPFLPGSDKYHLGGFSGLSYAGENEFWTITDRGPNVDSGNAKVFPTPSFNPTIVRLKTFPNGTLSVVQTIPLQQPGGGPVSGRPNPAPYNTGESAIDTNFVSIGTDEWGFDTEGLVRAADGTFWFCEEYAPGIAQVSSTGEILRRVRPQPTAGGLPDILKKRVPNRGAEGIAITPNGKIYTIVQSGMANSFANTASANTNAANQTELLRLVEFDPVSGASRMFAYLMDAGYPVTGSNIRRRDIKIGDMVALNNNELMLIEHAQRGSQNAKRIYKVNLAGATPLVTETFQTSPGVTKTLEELTRAELTSVAGITPVAKTLVLDLLNAGAGNPTWPTDADKPEGMTLIDPSTIVLANDNDFGVNSPNSDGIVTLTGAQSRLFVYKLRQPLDFQLGIQGGFAQGSQDLVSARALFEQTRACVGEGVVSLPITVSNNGRGTMIVYGIDMFASDSSYRQGSGSYALRRDALGRLVSSTDYVITAMPATMPLAANAPLTFPAYVPQGASFTVYANFAPQRPDNRFARVFIRTNATNFAAIDTDGVAPSVPNWGLLTVDLLGRGIGGTLANDFSGQPVKPVVFGTTKVGQTADLTFPIVNNGNCNLRISRKFLDIAAGDVNDFSIVSAFAGVQVDPSTNDYILTPGASTSITVRFAPRRSGSRRATVWLRSNDSAAAIPGVSERGSVYVDLYGTGQVTLTAQGITIGAAEMGRDAIRGTVRIANESRETITLTSLAIIDASASEFAPVNWPAVPVTIGAGGTLPLDVDFRPTAGGASGPRTAHVIGITSTGDTVTARLDGTAGTRSLGLAQKSLFSATSIPSGKTARELLVVTNTGSMPVTLGAPSIVGADAASYTVGAPAEAMIYPGGMTTIEVIFSPRKSGASQARLLISSSTATPDTVTLGGSATKAQRREEGLGSYIGSGIWENGSDITSGSAGTASADAVTGELSANALFAPVPFPARDRATIVYQLASRGDISLDLFDARGRMVMTIARGAREAGRHAETIDAGSLPAGTYQYRLRVGNDVLTRSMIVVR